MSEKFFYGLVGYRKIDDDVGFVLRAGKFFGNSRFPDSTRSFYQKCCLSVTIFFHWSIRS